MKKLKAKKATTGPIGWNSGKLHSAFKNLEDSIIDIVTEAAESVVNESLKREAMFVIKSSRQSPLKGMVYLPIGQEDGPSYEMDLAESIEEYLDDRRTGTDISWDISPGDVKDCEIVRDRLVQLVEYYNHALSIKRD